MNVAWIGKPYLISHLQNLGWNIAVVSTAEHSPFTWDDILDQTPFTPDLVVQGDESKPPLLCNPHFFPCPTLFFCIDSHIHSWYPTYAQLFDFCTVAMRDHIPRFLALGLDQEQVTWLPLFARDNDYPQNLQITTPICFVGKNDQNITPVRYKLLQEVSRQYPELLIAQGDYHSIYARSHIVLNIAEHGDLNFRVFEAMGCGKCLLTPDIGHGQSELFSDGHNLMLYDQENIQDLCDKIGFLLQTPSLCDEVGQNAFLTIETNHRERHRARELHSWITASLEQHPSKLKTKRQSAIQKVHGRPLYLLWADEIQNQHWKKRYVESAKLN